MRFTFRMIMMGVGIGVNVPLPAFIAVHGTPGTICGTKMLPPSTDTKPIPCGSVDIPTCLNQHRRDHISFLVRTRTRIFPDGLMSSAMQSLSVAQRASNNSSSREVCSSSSISFNMPLLLSLSILQTPNYMLRLFNTI